MSALRILVALGLGIAAAPHAEPQEPAPSASAAPQRLPVFPGGVEQVVVDVVVVDGQGRAVTGLALEDFTLAEEGAGRPILSFEAVAPADDAATGAANPAAQAPLPRVFALVFDDLHLTLSAGGRVKEGMKEMVGTVLRDSDEVVLMSTSSGEAWSGRLGSQRAALLAALEQLRGLRPPAKSCEMTDEEAMQIHLEHDLGVQQLVFERLTNCGQLVRQARPLVDAILPDGRPAPNPQGAPSGRDIPGMSMLGTWAVEQHEESARRIRATYATLERLLRALGPLRGRKTVVLGSEGFVRDRGLVEVKGVVTAASNTNAAVYFLDARDLTPRALTASGDARHSAGISEAGRLQQGRFFGAEASEQLALETGGTSIRGGDLAAGLKRLADESRSYYLLGYSPGDPSLDGKFRAIEVKVRQPGLSVRARRGYYAVARPGPTPANVAVTTAAATRRSAAAPAPPNPEAVAAYLRPPAEAAAELARWSPDQVQRALAALKSGSASDDVLESAALGHATAALVAVPSPHQARAAVQVASLVADAARRHALEERLYLGLAHGFLEARNWEMAQELAEQATNRLDQDADALLAFGIVQETTGSVDDAGHRPAPDQTILTSGFDEMVSRNPVTGFAAGVPGGPAPGMPRFQGRMTRKGAPTSEARLRRAAESYRKALKARPDLAEARLRLGRTLALLGSEKEATQELSTVASLAGEPDLAYLARLFLGDACEQRGDFAGAATEYRQAQAGRPSSAVARLALARALHGAGERGPAAEAIQNLLLEPAQDGARDPWWSYRLRPLGRWSRSAGSGHSMIARSTLALGVFLCAAPARAQQVALPGSSVEMVSVDVSVILEGRAVPGLTAERFDVRDEGTRRTVELVAAGDVPLHVMLVMDASDSVGGERVRRLVQSAQALFPDLRASDRVGLLTFSEEVRLLADVESSAPAVRALLGRVATGGGTSLRDAAWAALKRAESVRGRMLILLFTDGTDTSSWLTEDAVLALARESDSVVHVVSTADRKGPLSGDPFLARLAAITGGRLWEAGNAEEQELAVRRALAEMRSRYVLRFERPPDARAGWHRLEVKLRGVKGDLLARRGYFVPAPPR